MKRFSVVIVILCSKASFSQFSDSVTHYVHYATTGIFNKTNNGASFVLTNALRLSIRKKSISLNSSNNWVYGLQGDRLTNNDFSSVLDFNLYNVHNSLDRFYYWGLANYEGSYSLKTNNRLQLGAGGAYSFIDKPDAFLNVSDGLLYEYSDIDINDSIKRKYSTVRNSFRLRYRLVVKEVVVIDGTNFLQNSLSDGRDYIIKSSTDLSVKLRKWLSFTSTVNYNKVTVTARENWLITFGITMEKYF